MNTDVTIATDSVKGKFSITNPNYKNSDKSIYLTLDASETDNYKNLDIKQIKLVLPLVQDLNIMMILF